eukprot:TRINITY_DN31562_c0_g1_i1.p1 TRINITY_DN31562_c0_g1~~TRINITY_DN31562_c0_g1_i1.p1  ORF type:complete len:190 (-),score=49.33 TRINITY_DN31562_c0_g1_i1:91-660(-)
MSHQGGGGGIKRTTQRHPSPSNSPIVSVPGGTGFDSSIPERHISSGGGRHMSGVEADSTQGSTLSIRTVNPALSSSTTYYPQAGPQSSPHVSPAARPVAAAHINAPFIMDEEDTSSTATHSHTTTTNTGGGVALPTASSGKHLRHFVPMDQQTPTTTVSYTHLRAHETPEHLVCRLLLEKKKKHIQNNS